MGDAAKARKAGITRTDRNEAKGVIQGIREKAASLGRLVTDLRRRVFVLERENNRLMATIRKFQLESTQQPSKKSSKVR